MQKGRAFLRLKASSEVHTVFSLLVLAAILLVSPGRSAVAEDSLGLYVGAAIGQSRVEAKETAFQGDLHVYENTETLDQNRLAFQAMLGARPISLAGAEITYIDFGKIHGEAFGFPSSASVKGVAAFGVAYLPVPVVDLYLKAGVARLESTVDFIYCGPCACSYSICLGSTAVNRTNTSWAGGVGIQYRFGSWAARGEYERFNAAGENPSLVSAGLTWSFL
jgi:opacity protein-like surface antigen